MEREQTTLRISADLKSKIDRICAENDETLAVFLRSACKRIVKRYEFDDKGVLIVK